MNHYSIKYKVLLFVMAGILVSAISGWLANVSAQEAPGYRNYSALTKVLKQMADQHSDLARLKSIGQTAEGREIWLLTLANQKGTPPDQRPGILVAANFEGDHLIGSELTLRVADYLLRSYPDNETVKRDMDDYVFYLIPRINPDGAEKMFHAPVTGSKTNNDAFDGDHDGRLDEDGPEDLNGDGFISVMRVKDVHGLYMIDPDHPELMKKADPSKGEEGRYSLYWEGLDNDRDGFYNEDPRGGTDLNRNFQHAYPYYQEDAGKNMVSEPESRALMDWVVANRNISMILTFGESDNLITPPNPKGQFKSDRTLDLIRFADASNAEASKVGMISTGRRGYGRYGRFFMMGSFSGGQNQSSGRSRRPARKAATTVNTKDLPYFTKISKRYKELTGITTPPVIREPEGAFFQYAYFQYGVPAFCTPGWGLVLPADSSRGKRRASNPMMMKKMPARGQTRSSSPAGVDAQFLKYLKAKQPDGFVDWTSYMHPDLGEVEIGGFSPMAVSNPPVAQLDKLGEAHGKFIAWLPTLNAKIHIAEFEVTNPGGGLYRIKAEIENTGYLPTSTAHGELSRSVKPTMVQLEVDPDQILSGNSKTNFFKALAGSGGRQKYEWLIRGKRGDRIELKVVSQKAGSDHAILKLK